MVLDLVICIFHVTAHIYDINHNIHVVTVMMIIKALWLCALLGYPNVCNFYIRT